jgi:hypothetical protein
VLAATPPLPYAVRWGFALNESRSQATSLAQPPFEARHTAAVGRVVVIVSQEVQQAMQGQDFQLSSI